MVCSDQKRIQFFAWPDNIQSQWKDGKMGKWENLLAAGNANNAKSRFRLNRVSWTE